MENTSFGYDITNGLQAVLYKRISSVTINEERIKKAFTKFIDDVEQGESISVAEILYSAVAVNRNVRVDDNAGNIICALENITPDFKYFKYTVQGLHSLITLHNGIAIDLDKLGGNIKNAQLKNYIILPPKRLDKYSKKLRKSNVSIYKVGEMLSSNQIIIGNGGNITESIDKKTIGSETAVPVALNSSNFDAFLNGYLAVCSLKISNCITDNNILRFGLGGGIENVFARALGIYAAASLYRVASINLIFTDDNTATVAVPRPNVADGDYFYLLKLYVDEKGIPDRTHYSQLCYYLTEKKRMGIIKDVLPIRENIQSTLKRLSTEAIVYEPITDLPENSFGAIVSVPRGESVNGIKLGYFKCN